MSTTKTVRYIDKQSLLYALLEYFANFQILLGLALHLYPQSLFLPILDSHSALPLLPFQLNLKRLLDSRSDTRAV